MTDKTKRPARLRSIKLDELSLVDAPANTHARVTLFKRAGDDEEQRDMHKTETDGKPVSFDTFEAAVAHLHELHGGPRMQAMSKAAARHPDLLAAYQREGRERVEKALRRMPYPTVPPAVAEFRALMDQIKRRDNCTNTEALRRASAANPKLFAEYQSA